MATISEMMVRGNTRKIMDKDARKAVGFAGTTGGYPLNKFLPFAETMDNYVLDENAPYDVITSWTASNVRISNMTPAVFSQDEVIRVNAGYKFKPVQINPTTKKYISWPSDWYTERRLTANTPYIIVLARTNTNTQITPGEGANLYIDSIEKKLTDVDKLNTAAEKTLAAGKKPANALSDYYKDIKACSLTDTDVIMEQGYSLLTNDACYNIYIKNGARLTLYKRLLHFDRDTLIECSADYRFKAFECNAAGEMQSYPESWFTKFLLRGGNYYGLTMKRTDDATISPEEAGGIKNEDLTKSYDADVETRALEDPFARYRMNFFRASYDDETDDFNYSSNIRRTCRFIIDRPETLRMISPDYTFKLFWKDGDVQHSTDWDRVWELPVNKVGYLVIKKVGSDEQFGENERPEYFLVPYTKNSIPKDYFKAEIEDTVAKVNAANTEPGLCFLVSTDQHTLSVQGNNLKHDTITDMVTNMQAVAERIHVDAHIALGDIADFKVGTSAKFALIGITDLSYSNLDSVFYQQMESAMTKLKSVNPNFIYVPGNHDDNRYINRDKVQASQSAYDYTPGEMYSYYVGKGANNFVYNTGNNGLDYYVDFPNFKIRMFCLDANYFNDTAQTSSYEYTKAWWYGYSDATVTWFTNELANIPAGWSVLLCSHMSPIAENNADNYAFQNFDNIKNAIQSFISGGGSFIATLYGHTHGDYSVSSPWREISFACQKCQNSSEVIENMPDIVWPARTAGDYTEDCWNVVIIQPGSRKIRVIRFGAGNDAVYTY